MHDGCTIVANNRRIESSSKWLRLRPELGSDLLQILGPICFWLVGAHGWLDDVSVAWFEQVFKLPQFASTLLQKWFVDIASWAIYNKVSQDDDVYSVHMYTFQCNEVMYCS